MSRYHQDRHAVMSKKEKSQLIRESIMINRNPLLNEQKWDVIDTINHHLRIAHDAWNLDTPDYQRYYDLHVSPLNETLKTIKRMLFCMHDQVSAGEDEDYCLVCGAVNRGRGWFYADDDIHAPIVANITSPVQL